MLVRGAATGLRRDRADRGAARGRTRRQGPRRDAVRIGGLEDRRDPRLAASGAALAAHRPVEPGARARARLPRARRRVRRDQRPLGRHGRRAARPRAPHAGLSHGARTADGRGRPHLPRHRERQPAGRADLALALAAHAGRRPPVARQLPERARSRALPPRRRQGRLRAVPRPDGAGEGPVACDPRGTRARARDPARRQAAGHRGDRPLRRRGAPAARPGCRVPRRGVARREGRAAAAGARDDLPDLLARALRPRDDRVDGVRHAGRGDALRRGARGDRGRRRSRHRRRRARPRRRTSSARSSCRARTRATWPCAASLRAHGRRLHGRLPEAARRARDAVRDRAPVQGRSSRSVRGESFSSPAPRHRRGRDSGGHPLRVSRKRGHVERARALLARRCERARRARRGRAPDLPRRRRSRRPRGHRRWRVLDHGDAAGRARARDTRRARRLERRRGALGRRDDPRRRRAAVAARRAVARGSATDPRDPPHPAGDDGRDLRRQRPGAALPGAGAGRAGPEEPLGDPPADRWRRPARARRAACRTNLRAEPPRRRSGHPRRRLVARARPAARAADGRVVSRLVARTRPRGDGHRARRAARRARPATCRCRRAPSPATCVPSSS